MSKQRQERVLLSPAPGPSSRTLHRSLRGSTIRGSDCSGLINYLPMTVQHYKENKTLSGNRVGECFAGPARALVLVSQQDAVRPANTFGSQYTDDGRSQYSSFGEWEFL